MTQFSERINKIRQDYQMASLNEDQAGDNPFSFFIKWFDEAQESEIADVNAMTLATATADGIPDARMVLLKGLDDDGSFVFYTNYNSHKGEELLANPYAALVFYWKELERQVRVTGHVEKTSELDSDAYFNSRPLGSRIGAMASLQSQKIASRSIIEKKVKAIEFDGKVERPKHWGGFKVIPSKIEFWQGRSSRLHDRIVFEKNENAEWEKYRLAP